MNRHESQRGYFTYALHEHMSEDKTIWVITGDLGYGALDAIRQDFPNRFINAGASEQAMMGVAVGLAAEQQKPFVYSITPFLLARPFETIRNYVDHEEAPVRLVGSGRMTDYAHDGFSHDASDAVDILKLFPNIARYFPTDKSQIPNIVDIMVKTNRPQFISLRR